MNRSISGVKTWTIVSAIFGIIVSLIGMGEALYYYKKLNLDPQIELIIVTLIVFACALSVSFSSYIVYFAMTSDEDTFSNNRYILMLFSLSVGGLITPYLLMKLPNTNVQTTITPRVSISRGYGYSFLATGLVTLLTFIGLYAKNSGISSIMDGDFKTYNILIVAISGAMIFWGLLNVATFSAKSTEGTFEKKGAAYTWMMILSTINLIIGTISLIWVIIASVLNIISLISDIFNRRDGLLAIFTIPLILLRIAMQFFVIYTAANCMKSIWAPKGYTYGQYQKLASREEDYLSSRKKG
ncbi:hypothetical protein [Spiroplasma tabanidicola]|uniref:Uncharacterized protein n=1 Tax=Spiroplasma tabanidicola TaxID=324079 RepID=A0A6I6CD70_9MOLU|nr:hypothetical protein [Spiroplasma tabanidicola]QGS52248.1 hypothetical protein STABA_v1c08930 [Spiroplasma tabanidicola]